MRRAQWISLLAIVPVGAGISIAAAWADGSSPAQPPTTVVTRAADGATLHVGDVVGQLRITGKTSDGHSICEATREGTEVMTSGDMEVSVQINDDCTVTVSSIGPAKPDTSEAPGGVTISTEVGGK